MTIVVELISIQIKQMLELQLHVIIFYENTIFSYFFLPPILEVVFILILLPLLLS